MFMPPAPVVRQKRKQAKAAPLPLTDTRGQKLSRKEIEAQLRLYGIACPGLGSMRVGDMRDLLGKMVKDGKVRTRYHAL